LAESEIDKAPGGFSVRYSAGKNPWLNGGPRHRSQPVKGIYLLGLEVESGGGLITGI
jgi:hypothetical protein